MFEPYVSGGIPFAELCHFLILKFRQAVVAIAHSFSLMCENVAVYVFLYGWTCESVAFGRGAIRSMLSVLPACVHPGCTCR